MLGYVVILSETDIGDKFYEYYIDRYDSFSMLFVVLYIMIIIYYEQNYNIKMCLFCSKNLFSLAFKWKEP